ncbi:methyltransferase domain-containing protein [Parapedobacter indicus]|uniref:Trans-aconitate 2-methyltransferase n=1 Tax=Parapedobacter indicus TaxID=1477437 RepID=A0A1I3J0Z7_9SPHI|nr:methyltransferase domain-containing protein [Parapedobacter indicus]PPL02360.1 trans-aconitate 2-methyltransferase [Parapedobacter indicus]SFI53937.1 trans-aconitate 2-methyltransferase [Parapedobacter indicus]
MPWNPELYNQFKQIRYKPFYDLVNLISAENVKNCVDIGCGTGEQTSILSEKFENVNFLGIDSSEEMLNESNQFTKDNLHFEWVTIEEFAHSTLTWDLIFSNAALQWSDNHAVLFPKLIANLNSGGQFAVQMPFQPENVLNTILLEIVTEKPFVDLLRGFIRNSPVLTIDDYTKLLFDCGLKGLNVSLKVYPIIATSEIELYNFISGSALIPYMERLDRAGQELLKSVFIQRIQTHFISFPAIYPFKRILMYGVSG